MENRMSLTERTKALAITKWTMRKYLPFSIAYWILLFLSFVGVEIVLLTITAATKYDYGYAKEMKECIYYIPSTGFAAIAILYSVIIAIMAFSYMHNKRSVDFFGSMPVGRRGLFFSRYFAVVLLCIVPIVLIGAVGAIFSGSVESFFEAAKVLGILIVTVIGNISFIAFISVCCGTVADVIVSYSVINIVYPICVFICSMFPRNIIPGFSGGYVSTTLFTLGCPVAAPFTAFFGTGLEFHMFWWILLSVILMIGCYYLCKKRKAETAQNAFAFSAVEIVIKFVTCFATGFGLGWVMAYIGEAMDSVRGQYIWFAIGMIIGIMVANILLHLIFHRGLSKYKNSLKECGVVAFAVTAFLLCVTSGVFGFDTRIPKAEDVVEVGIKTNFYEEFIVNGEDILLYNTDDEQTINDTIDFQKQIIQNAEKCKRKGLYPIISEYYSTDYYYGENGDFNGIDIRYKLKNGNIIERKYARFYGEVDKPETLKNVATDSIVKLNAIPIKYLSGIGITKNQGENEGISYYIWKTDKHFRSDDVAKIVDAIKKDIAAGVPKNSEKEDYNDYIYEISIEYEKLRGRYSSMYTTAYFYITEDYTNTLRALEETGYGNVMLNSMLQQCGIFQNSDELEYTKNGKEIYFNVPEEWNSDIDVRCMPYCYEYDDFIVALEDDISKCEKVSDNVYKYIMPEMDDYEFTNIMFYQYSDTEFHGTGFIPIDVGEENILTTYDYKEAEMWEVQPWCEYKWTK